MASCGEDKQTLTESRNTKHMSKDTVFEYNIGDEDYKSIGTRFICTETIDIAQYDVFEKEEKRKTLYEAKGLFGNLSIDTIYNAKSSFVKDEAMQNYQDKIIIKCGINYISNSLATAIPPKEILNSYILKDLNSGKVEKIVLYVDSVEYMLDVNKLNNKPVRRVSFH